MREQVVEFSPHLQDPGRRAFFNHLFGNDLDQSFPVWRRYGGLFRDLVAAKWHRQHDSSRLVLTDDQIYSLLRMHRLVHQQCPPQVSPTLFRYPLFQSCAALQALLFADALQYGLNLLYARRCDSDEQASTPDGRNDIACAVCQEYETKVWAVLFHRATEGGLSIASEMVGFIDHHDLEALFGGEIDLLCLRYFFEEILDDDAVIVADV